MAKEESELESTEIVRSVPWLRAGLLFLLIAGIVAIAMSVRERVETRHGWEDANWEYSLEALPSYIPVGFKGELAKVETLLDEVSLSAPNWRESLESALLRNPWVSGVRKLERGEGDEILFSLRCRRPVVALRDSTGYLLVDSHGLILDHQPGDELSERWRIPFCTLVSGLPEPTRSGARLDSAELHELLALVRALREKGIFPRYLDRVPEIVASPDADDPSHLMWSLVLVNGAELVWGRSPAGILVSPLDLETKRQNFARTMNNWSSIRPRHRISLCRRAEPIYE